MPTGSRRYHGLGIAIAVAESFELRGVEDLRDQLEICFERRKEGVALDHTLDQGEI